MFELPDQVNRDALIETGKSFLRGVWFAALGGVVTYLTALASNADLLQTNYVLPGLQTEVPVGLAFAAMLTGAIKLIDRYVHKSTSRFNGLAPSKLQ